MKTKDEIPVTYAAFGYLLDDDGRVLLVANNYDQHGIMWGLPGGGMEEGESPEDCVVREFGEEVGLKVEVVRPVGAIERFKPDWDLNLFAYFFEVALLEGIPRVDPDEEHVVDLGYFSAEEILDKDGTVLGRLWIVDYLKNSHEYPKNIVMEQDEE